MGTKFRRRIFNDELVILVKQVLRVCDQIRHTYEKKECNFVEKILNYVYCVASKKREQWVESLYEKKISCIITEKERGKMQFQSVKNSVDFAKIREAVSKQFVAVEVQKDLIKQINELAELSDSKELNSPFPAREFIEKYWAVYTGILVFLIRHEEIISDIQGKREILKPLLNFCDVDRVHSDKKEDVSISIHSPISLYLMLTLYYRIEEYLTLDFKKNEEQFQKIYHGVITKQLLQSYRWFLADEKQNLYLAALSPFVEQRSQEHKLLIPVHSLESYDSYDGVRELRLAEKILFELEHWDVLSKNDKENDFTYKVVILGDLQKEPVKELGNYIAKIIENQISIKEILKSRNIKIHFNIYTKMQYNRMEDCQGSEKMYSYTFHYLEDELRNREKLNELVDEHQLMFLLDNMDLYNKLSVDEYYNPEFYKQRLKYYDYSECLEDIRCSKNKLHGDVFWELHETLTAYLYSGKWGKFKKTANNVLLQYMEHKINTSESQKAIYVYVSDLDAFYDVYCNDEYFVRKEQYNNKEIGIIRYSKRKEEILKNREESPHVLCFNVWQFVKHIVVDERQYFLEKLLPYIFNTADLKQIHIGIRYDQWRERLVLDYCLEDKKLETPRVEAAVEDFVKNTLIPIFNEEHASIYSEYIFKSICSFLYGNVANVEDMLFLHLFKNHRGLIGKVEYTGTHDPDVVRQNINKRFKYSFKRYYDMAMKTYDITASEYIGQYKAVEMITKCDDLRLAWSRGFENAHSADNIQKGVFEQIKIACENLQYTDSYLYDRCNALLRG